MRRNPPDEPSKTHAVAASPASCELRSASRAWIYGAVAVCSTVGLLLVALTAPQVDGLVIGTSLLIYAAALARCLGMSVRTDGETAVVHNGFRSSSVPLSQITGVRRAVRPNIGLLSGAWYWSLRRRSVWLTLEGGNEVRAAVFTEMRSNGEWHSIGEVDAEVWLRTARQ